MASGRRRAAILDALAGGIGDIGQIAVSSIKEEKERKRKAPLEALQMRGVEARTEAAELGLQQKKAGITEEEEVKQKVTQLADFLNDPLIQQAMEKPEFRQAFDKALGTGPTAPQPQRAPLQGPLPRAAQGVTSPLQLAEKQGLTTRFAASPTAQAVVQPLRQEEQREEAQAQRQQEIGERRAFETEAATTKFGRTQQLQEERLASSERLAGQRVQQQQAKQAQVVQQKETKRSREQRSMGNGIEAILTMAEGVKPGGRAKGAVSNVFAAVGWNPKLASLNNTAGLLAGQVAKKIGGESGRLTDQDRVYALNVMPKSIDTKAERRIKVAVLKAFQNPDLKGADVRDAIYRAMNQLSAVEDGQFSGVGVGTVDQGDNTWSAEKEAEIDSEIETIKAQLTKKPTAIGEEEEDEDMKLIRSIRAKRK